jgi:hypothetical protein
MKLAHCLLLLVSCLAYSSTLEMKANDGQLSAGTAQCYIPERWNSSKMNTFRDSSCFQALSRKSMQQITFHSI